MDKTRNHQRFAVTAHSSYACHGILAVLLFLQPFAPNAVTSDGPVDRAASAEPSESPPSAETPAAVESDLLTVSTRPNLTFEGGAVRTTIRVGKDWRNRALRLSIDGERFGASSEFWLEGADAAIVHERLWPTLPGGVYEVRVAVERSDGSTKVARTQFQVVGRESATIPLEGQSPVGTEAGTLGRGPVTAATPF